jgi:hypothetical protein
MVYQSTRLWIAAILTLGLSGCGESEKVGTVDVKIVEREDFTYSEGYSNGCRFKVQIINNTDMPLAKLEAFIMDGEEFLFSISGELPIMGASIRTHDVQQNKRCKEIGRDLNLKKNACSLGTKSAAECYALMQIVPPGA